MNLPKSLISKSLIAGCALFGLSSCGGGGDYSRSYLDQYVELETAATLNQHAMESGVAVYVDFSDGMNAAYGTQLSKDALRKVINVFTDASGKTAFYSLADSKISPLDLPQTELYNAIMSGKNYNKTKAPIEETLKEIVNKRQPALLITDFEEYNGGVIQQQNYAKSYFIDWLSKGYSITFYKIDYKEGSKPKHLYFTVFDSPLNTLGTTVEQALSQYIGQGVDRYVLAGPECSYELAVNYPSSTKGGNYHNTSGDDIVSAVVEDGKGEAYYSYPYNLADKESAKSRSDYARIKTLYGPFTEYYPLGDSYGNIMANIASTQEEGVAPADRFTHLLSKLFVNFTVQNGFDVKKVKAKVVDFQPEIEKFILRRDSLENEGVEISLPEGTPNCKEVLDMFTVSIEPVVDGKPEGAGWKEILFDFDPRFKGEIPASMATEKDLLKVDIVISEATPIFDGITEFFAWPGNNSLAESVRNTLNDPKVNPTGQVIVTYYIKVL